MKDIEDLLLLSLLEEKVFQKKTAQRFWCGYKLNRNLQVHAEEKMKSQQQKVDV